MTLEEQQERAREAHAQIETLRAAVVDELDELPEVQQWLVRVLAAAESTLFRHRPALSSPSAAAAGKLGCVGCGLDWTEELLEWPCEEVLPVLDTYVPVCRCGDDYDRGGNRFVDPSDCPLHALAVTP